MKNSIGFLIGLIVFFLLLLLHSKIGTKTNFFIHYSIDLFLCASIACFALLYSYKKEQELYESEYDYNYNRENPNALVSGYNVSGTVYASYPENSPGLGWIL